MRVGLHGRGVQKNRSRRRAIHMHRQSALINPHLNGRHVPQELRSANRLSTAVRKAKRLAPWGFASQVLTHLCPRNVIRNRPALRRSDGAGRIFLIAKINTTPAVRDSRRDHRRPARTKNPRFGAAMAAENDPVNARGGEMMGALADGRR